ncbi:uncharacterized protein KGF55_005371 [Candida pseudojiufengensis]|uniref:uncharacterized protein n=1 Tax=Candida pseudojiufengensis TaxID=497109 RepID=UPI0022253D3C|nr:uncharacterized protein KGF55_005371 [Candida pseudojiufengensis]KAI5959394.1 hypothetical protein KGF55_005371 [Candida pseudojiufengensis]
MAYKRSYSKSNQQSSNQDQTQQEETEIILDSKKRVTVRKFNNVNLVDIREYYIDSNGEKKPGKKGISLTEESYYKLIESHNKIQNALDILNGGSKTNKEPVSKKPKIDKVNDEESKKVEQDGEEVNLKDEDFVDNDSKDTKKKANANEEDGKAEDEEVSEEED